MTDISDYLSRSEFAAELGITSQTLKKREESAEGTEFALPEPVKKGAMKLYHRRDWEKMNGGRLAPYIEEAVKLGLVVAIEEHENLLAEDRRIAYDQGFRDGVNSVASGLPEDGSEDLELLEHQEASDALPTGLTHGGFQPLSTLGL